MSRRFISGAALIAVLALFAGACGSDDSADETTTTEKSDTTTTEKSTDDSTDDSTGDDPSDAVSDAEFEDQVDAVAAQMELAGTDSCALMDAMLGSGSTELPDPSSPEQVKTAMGLLETLAESMTTAATPENAVAAAEFSAAMTAYADEAAENDYDPEWFNDDETDPLDEGAAAESMQSYFETAALTCPAGTLDG